MSIVVGFEAIKIQTKRKEENLDLGYGCFRVMRHAMLVYAGKKDLQTCV